MGSESRPALPTDRLKLQTVRKPDVIITPRRKSAQFQEDDIYLPTYAVLNDVEPVRLIHDTGADVQVEYVPFQFVDRRPSAPHVYTTHPVGGVIIAYDGQPRLVLVADDYLIQQKWDNNQKMWVQHTYLLKMDPDDSTVLIESGYKDTEPHILQNEYEDRPGMDVYAHRIKFTYRDGQILIDRFPDAD